MIFEFGQYKIDVDVEKTKKFYEQADLVTEGCSCDGCQNFEKAVETLPVSVRDFFSKLGVDVRKICECYVLCTNEDGTLSYGGFCHICGVLISGESAWGKCDKAVSRWEERKTFAISESFQISFQEEIDLLEDDFPLPVIQLEFTAEVPWVLDRENNYM